jgi:subtilisin family serine protease
MRRTLAAAALLALAACADDSTAPLAPAAPEGPGKYIVVMRDEAFPGPRLSVAAGVRGVADEAGIRPKYVYESAIKGFAAELTAAQLARLRADPRVAYVDRDAEAQLFFTTQFNPTWGIDRIDQVDLPRSHSYTYTSTGSGVRAYVLDTGIRRTHRDFGGRASYIPNATNGDFVLDGHGSAEDCHGHGTHVAGTVGSTTYGVAKKVTLIAGRVVNCSGGGNASMVIAAMDWIIANGVKPAVVNMSLGYGDVPSVRDAATRLVRAGFFVAAAAGNGDFLGTPQNACLQSPAGSTPVMTVGSTDSLDAESSFSNYGKCVDILAPGSSVRSLGIATDTSTSIRSGTSMATPHVAGVAAQYLQTHPTTDPTVVVSVLKSVGTPGTITLHSASVMNGTPNLFLRTVY